jgi:hypothetical protein
MLFVHKSKQNFMSTQTKSSDFGSDSSKSARFLSEHGHALQLRRL